jgi:restriction endonuclease Mrr
MGPGKVRSNLGITTSSVERIVQSSTALSDGNQLADLMIEHNVGNADSGVYAEAARFGLL